MRKSTTFTATGFDRLEGRMVLSHVAAAPGVIHGHKAKLVASDFAGFQSTFNNTIAPLVKDMQSPTTPADQAYSDSQQIRTTITSMVNGLGNQLASQLHRKMFSRIRSVITGASEPSAVGFATSSPATGSLLATLNALPQSSLANSGLVNNLATVYQDALITGHSATRVKGDFVNFERSFNKTITPMVEHLWSASTSSETAEAQQKIDAAIADLVNDLGNHLATNLGAKAQPAIRSWITGGASGSGSSLTPGTPTAGSLLATLKSVPATELTDWDLIADLVTVYARTSPTFD